MIKKIILGFIFWRLALFLISFLAVFLIPTFGGSFPYYNVVLQPTNLPSWIWGFGNFDGVHYLRIAQNGYNAQFSQAFFPLFPFLIHAFNFISKNPVLDTKIYVDPSYFFMGLVLSNIFFLFSLILFYKLIRIDFNPKVAFGSLILLASFPTSFYFGSIYTESLFLFLVLGTFYFIRKGNFLAAGVFSALASATRVLGLLLLPVLLVEIYMRIKKQEIKLHSEILTKAITGILIAPFGALLYMLYLRLNFDNPLYFLTSQPAFGAQRSENLIFPPQVLYRYFKIFMTVPLETQLFFNASLEFAFTTVILIGILLFIKKLRISYLIFILGSLVIPTLTGTLSSMPRYSLMAFLLLPYTVQSLQRYYLLLVGFFMIIGIILVGLFTRGYWVA